MSTNAYQCVPMSSIMYDSHAREYTHGSGLFLQTIKCIPFRSSPELFYLTLKYRYF